MCDDTSRESNEYYICINPEFPIFCCRSIRLFYHLVFNFATLLRPLGATFHSLLSKTMIFQDSKMAALVQQLDHYSKVGIPKVQHQVPFQFPEDEVEEGEQCLLWRSSSRVARDSVQ